MNLRQVRKKTKSVSNVRKITKSMQLVYAIKMKKSQQAAMESRSYQEHLESIIQKIVGKMDPKFSKLLSQAGECRDRDLVIFISSNKGLCGSFNFDLFRFIAKEVDFSRTDFIVIGKKGASFIHKLSGVIVADFSAGQPLLNVSAVFAYILSHFLKGSYKSVDVIYNKFISALKTEPVRQKLLPFTFVPSTKIEEKQVHEYLIEPRPEELIDSLLHSFVEEKIRNVCIQSEAGEHSARMIAMKNATDNANDVIYNLTLLGNKLRQEKITSELLDMVTAKESVGN